MLELLSGLSEVSLLWPAWAVPAAVVGLSVVALVIWLFRRWPFLAMREDEGADDASAAADDDTGNVSAAPPVDGRHHPPALDTAAPDLLQLARPPEPWSRADLPYDVFVSYARRDNQGGRAHWVEAFIWRLNRARRQVGAVGDFNVFFDTVEIDLMHEWKTRLGDGIRESAVLAALLSRWSWASEMCTWEWDRFHEREVQLGMRRAAILPVHLEPMGLTPEPDAIASFFEVLPEEVRRPSAWTEIPAMRLPDRISDMRARQRVELHNAYALTWRELMNTPALEPVFQDMAERIEDTLARARARTGMHYDPYFVGRRQQLDDLNDHLNKGLGVITAIQSLGGLGKTALARRHGQEQADRYAGRVWELACEDVRELDVALHGVGVDLEVQLDLPPEAQIATIVRGLQERCGPRGACLLIFDNVTEPKLLFNDTLEPLLNRPWLHLLATTRLPHTELGAGDARRHIIELSELPIDDAVELIQRRQHGRTFPSEAEAKAARGIAEHLGGFTLAVEAAAITVGRPDSGFTCAGLLKRLRADVISALQQMESDPSTQAVVKHREKLLSLTLSPTLASLTPAGLHVVRLASLFPPDLISEPWLRALAAQEHSDLGASEDEEAGTGPSPWVRVRNRLVGLQLLLERDGRQILRMNRLLGAFLHRQWTKKGQQDGWTLFVKMLSDPNILAEIDGYSSLHDLRRCWERVEQQTEHRFAEVARRLVAGGTSVPIAALTAIERVLLLQGHYEECLQVISRREAEARKSGDTWAQYGAVSDRAGVYKRLGQNHKALEDIRTLRKLAANLPSDELVQLALSNEAVLLYEFYLEGEGQERLMEALRLLKQSIAMAADMQSAYKLAFSLGTLGLVWRAIMNWDEAEMAFTQSLDIARSANEPDCLARALLNLSAFRIETGDYQAARVLLREARLLAHDMDPAQRHQLATLLDRVGSDVEAD